MSQFNFPDHTKLVLSKDGRHCSFTCLPERAWNFVKQYDKFPASTLEERSILSQPVSSLLAAPTRDNIEARRAQLNHLPLKLRFVIELMDQWLGNGGLGCLSEASPQLEWEGFRFDGDSKKENVVIGGSGDSDARA